MFQVGDIVSVRDYRPEREDADRYLVRVTASRYLAGDPDREFVGVVLEGHRWAGKTQAILNRDAVPVSESDRCLYCDVPIVNGGPYCEDCLGHFYGSEPCAMCGVSVAGWPDACPSCGSDAWQGGAE